MPEYTIVFRSSMIGRPELYTDFHVSGDEQAIGYMERTIDANSETFREYSTVFLVQRTQHSVHVASVREVATTTLKHIVQFETKRKGK